ncbi:hypothetical protein H5202_09800 [Shewanella sp. SG41-4]|uniref:hypothetical protein n=1 Tax=Shewanella sp. SG41-4 TaxID=2760976 RepID=UPI00160178DD|nr:hypothetical protein [Shewanella sp. SG41-4]MBB1438962.1 hypothetical protein [Shewanella sp. SG41-4]
MEYIDFYKAIKEKQLNELTLEELAFVHLNGRSFNDIKHGQICSVLPLVIGEIRHVKFNMYSQNFLPVAAAFTVLDQLGFCYSRSDMPTYSDENASSIKKSLYYFCDFSKNDNDTKTLYALRNSFLHTASCLSKSERGNQPNHSFVFDKDSTELIKYPETQWNGDFHNLDESMSTIINPTMLVDLIEAAIERALKCLYEGSLDVSCESGAEFYYRFLKFHPQKSS